MFFAAIFFVLRVLSVVFGPSSGEIPRPSAPITLQEGRQPTCKIVSATKMDGAPSGKVRYRWNNKKWDLPLPQPAGHQVGEKDGVVGWCIP